MERTARVPPGSAGHPCASDAACIQQTPSPLCGAVNGVRRLGRKCFGDDDVRAAICVSLLSQNIRLLALASPAMFRTRLI